MVPAPVSPSKLPRLTSWWLIALALSALVFFLAPQQIPVSLYKLNLLALAAVGGYWIDRAIFFYARPQLSALRCLWDWSSIKVTPEDQQRGYVVVGNGQKIPIHEVMEGAHSDASNDPAKLYFMLGCMLRRAIIIAAAMLAISMGG
ncbi:putative holin [Comamonas sp.]|uniref:putative holin n=1 Tax=Comamonas sp. TaxID=34028 RepID=UPI00258D1A08|nr:putative holin [Comamonas sp.]